MAAARVEMLARSAKSGTHDGKELPFFFLGNVASERKLMP